MYDQVVNCITKPPIRRHEEEVERIFGWFVQKSSLFSSLKDDVVKDIIRNCEFEEVQKDTIIIRQGDQGDRFFVILSGRVSVYINTDAVPDNPEDAVVVISPAADTLLPVEQDDLPEYSTPQANGRSISVPSQKYTTSVSVNDDVLSEGGLHIDDDVKLKPKELYELNRSLYGNHIVTLESGKSFGELALINEDCIRNASIIADECVHLLAVRRELYNRCLRAAQETEFKERTDFVNCHPLFANWQPRFKRQAAMSLRREQLHFGMDIVRQGEPINGLVFIIKGQAKIVMDVTMHTTQYPHLKLNEMQEEKKDQLLVEHNQDNRRDSKSRLWECPKRRQNYAIAEQRRALKNLEISLVGPGEIIGYVEKAFDLSTYKKSYIATVTSEVFYLDEKNFDRLISPKRNSKSMLVIREEAEMRVLSRIARSLDKQVPLLRCLIHQTVMKHKPEDEFLNTVSESTNQNVNNSSKFSPHKSHSSVQKHHIRKKKTLPTSPSKRKHVASSTATRLASANQSSSQCPVSERNSEPSSANKGSIIQTTSASTGAERVLGIEWEDEMTFLDWETSGEHLSSLEDRLKDWFSNVSLVDQSSKPSVIKLRRYIRKDEAHPIHPGKTILLRPRKLYPQQPSNGRNNWSAKKKSLTDKKNPYDLPEYSGLPKLEDHTNPDFTRRLSLQIGGNRRQIGDSSHTKIGKTN